jgi:hypothetical protein
VSPGPLTNEEVLLRLVFYNEHIRPDGSLEPAAINKSDFERPNAARPAPRGVSTNRQFHAAPEILKSKASAHRQRARDAEARSEVWAYTCNVRRLRALSHEKERSVCVVDRAEIDDPSHAEIWGSAPRPPSVLRLIRDQVIGLLDKGYKVV